MSSTNIIVRVLVNGQHIDISCGKAEQSFQWLATVVQQRIKQFNLMRKSLQQEAFIVTDIRNQDGELINPQDKVYEHIGTNGLTVRATVATSYPVDDWENPKINDWMQVAYIHSKAGYQWATEIEGWRQTLSAAHDGDTVSYPSSSRMPYMPNVHATNNSIAKKLLPSQSSLIQIGEYFTPQDVENAFNLDWQAMSWRWLASPSFTDVARSRLGVVMKDNYALVCNLFMHYAGEGRLGQRYGMTLQEFGHCVHFAKIVEWKFSEEAVKRIFFATAPETMQQSMANATGGRSSEEAKEQPRNGFALKRFSSEEHSAALNGSSSASSLRQRHQQQRWPLMTRAHFAEALVSIALEERFSAQPDEALRAMCHGPLGDFWQALHRHYLCYTHDERVLIHHAVHDFALLLRQMFHHYAALDATFGARLFLSDFIALLQDAGIVTESDQETLCTAAFLAAQLNPTVQQENDSIVFPEFLEAVARVAVKAIASYAGLTEGKKIRMALNMVIEMITNDSTSGGGGGGGGGGGSSRGSLARSASMGRK